MQTVESTMVDLGQMFNKLAGLVALQREGLERYALLLSSATERMHTPSHHNAPIHVSGLMTTWMSQWIEWRGEQGNSTRS